VVKRESDDQKTKEGVVFRGFPRTTQKKGESKGERGLGGRGEGGNQESLGSCSGRESLYSVRKGGAKERDGKKGVPKRFRFLKMQQITGGGFVRGRHVINDTITYVCN